MNSTARFSITAALLLGAALLLHGRNRGEILPPRAPLSSFPHTLGNWTSTDIAISKDVLDVLGPGDFLLRDFQDSQTKSAVGLFIAYFPSQRSGDTIHSPKNCLPGAGWTPVHSDRITVTLPGRLAFPANRYLIAKGEDRQLVMGIDEHAIDSRGIAELNDRFLVVSLFEVALPAFKILLLAYIWIARTAGQGCCQKPDHQG